MTAPANLIASNQNEGNKENAIPPQQTKVNPAPEKGSHSQQIEEVKDYPEPKGVKKEVKFSDEPDEVHEISPNKKSDSVVKKLLETKEFKKEIPENIHIGDLEQHIWKKNIVENRKNTDFLDISKEDFSEQHTISVEG